MKIGLGFDSIGSNLFKLQQGPDYDSNRMYLSVQIIDDHGGIATYYINTPVTVTKNSNTTYASSIISSILSGQTTSDFNKMLFSGNTQTVLNVVSSISSMLNSMSNADLSSQSGLNKTIN